MKIFIKIVIVCFVTVFFAQTSFANEYNFKKTKWGMSKSQVKSSESLKIHQNTKTTLLYKTSILNKKVLLGYTFVDNQLVSTGYLLAESHSNNNSFISDYEDFKKTLTKKYGKPKADRIVWKNDLYKDTYSSWGMAISVGHLVYLSSWELEDTIIDNILMGDNFKITHMVRYNSKKLKELEEKDEEKKALDAL